MHKPEQRLQRLAIYRFLARYHGVHHRHPNRNFNVRVPAADYVLGTSVRANERDLAFLKQAGFVNRIAHRRQSRVPFELTPRAQERGGAPRDVLPQVHPEQVVVVGVVSPACVGTARE
jgi:sterol desaturase/sphingolipid hydroxylase (fatty acid hydroxylase superfamily)